ncbi:MAG: calcium-binding protein, partial [Actinomycetota bacterium]
MRKLRNSRTDEREVKATLLERPARRPHLVRRVLAAAALAGGAVAVSPLPAGAAVVITDAAAFDVAISAAEDVEVDCDGTTATSEVRVTVDGVPDTTPATDCDDVTSLTVTGDTGTATDDNLIDVSGVIAPFTGLDGDITLDGGDGDDEIIGSGFADDIDGGDEDDTITGAGAADTIAGEAGTDGIDESGDVSFTLTNTSLTGLGSDTLATIEEASLTGGASANTITASSFTAGPVTLDGAAGNDTLTGGAEGDTLTGGTGNDGLTGGAGVDSLTAGAGDDSLNGGTGGDSLTGGSENDILTGAAGDDSLTGDDGTDRVVETADASFTLTNTTLTGDGSDTLATIEGATLTGGAAANTINASAFTAGPVTLDGAAGNDTLTGGSAADTLLGAAGADGLTGGAGNDVLTGAADNDALTGGDGT